MSKKKPSLTPLQQEALRIEEERRRRKEALQSAQQYALREALSKKVQQKTLAQSSEQSSSSQAMADFDTIREALRNERHHDAVKNNGINPRYVASVDDQSLGDE